MKNAFILFTANLVALTCAGFAGWLAYKQIEGWGWFLFCALLTMCTLKTSKEDKNDG